MEVSDLIHRLLLIEKYCVPKDDPKLLEMTGVLLSGDEDTVQTWADTFPTQDVLMSKLVEKLKGKSVYKTLKSISEGKVDNTSTSLKGLFSLGTHIAIEVESGNKEYGMLLPLLHERIGKIVFGE